jgi:TM2 domain-containing membrane protein YozV
MVYSFQGNIDLAKDVLDTRWLIMYIPVYLFTIWDSYRTTVDMNKIYYLADHENHRFNTFSIGAVEINYLDIRNPVIAVIWSLFVPGLGQLYIQRIMTSFFVIFWVVVFLYFSHAQEAVSLLFLGKVEQATSVLNPEWLLFLPSHYGFATFDAYISAVIRLSNELILKKQKRILRGKYSEIILIIECQEVKSEVIENILWNHFAIGVAKVK